MSSDDLYITKYCLIRNNKVLTEKGTFFTQESEGRDGFFRALYQNTGYQYPKFYKMDSLSKLGFLCAEILLQDRDLNNDYGSDGTSIVLSNSSSSLETDMIFQDSINDRNNYFPSPSVFVYTLPNLPAGEICIRHKFHGENVFFVTKSFNPAMIHVYASDIIRNGFADCCIAGWLEADFPFYEAFFCLIEKYGSFNNGITIFDVDTVEKLYSRNN
jgi:hypothetical protein